MVTPAPEVENYGDRIVIEATSIDELDWVLITAEEQF